MPGLSVMLAYLLALSALAQGAVRPVHSTQTRAAFWDNAAGRQPYKKRDMTSLRDIITPQERSAVTVEQVASLIAEVPILASSIVERYVDTDGDGLVSYSELLELWK